ncbi:MULTISPECIES: hypothetical protein [unclassified Agrobacterium]|uniref:hypothetical protein n=1 Tax=unclassified Agrobacterium TaxID=2632611 RepID=UPI0012378EE0|nr:MULTISPECIES: hypothetical protein [unclassified Agrobacterium]QGG89972.1 hypothetical protein GH983_05635 [Agrobacterium sp. MA01]
MAISSIIYAQFEHNKRQRKPAIAGTADVESFALDCKGGFNPVFAPRKVGHDRGVMRNAFPDRENR